MTQSAQLSAAVIRERFLNSHSPDGSQNQEGVSLLRNSWTPEFGIVLGSGLSAVVEQIRDAVTIPYQDLPGFPTQLIEGQQSQLTVGYLEGIPVVGLQGRSHYYGGIDAHPMLTYIRTLKLLGCHTVIITGAVGSLHAEVKPGQIVLLKDHINFQGQNPLVGINDLEFGPRFPDMTETYDRPWRQQFEKVGHDLLIPLIEGIYISVLGPSFETPAEIRLFREWGADIIGMSVVPEVIIARHCGLRVVGLGVVTNLSAGLVTIPQSHEETLLTARQSTLQITRLLQAFMGSVR